MDFFYNVNLVVKEYSTNTFVRYLIFDIFLDSTESPVPGCSDAASQYSENTDDVISCVEKKNPVQPTVSSDDFNEEKHSKSLPVQHFEITEEKPNT